MGTGRPEPARRARPERWPRPARDGGRRGAACRLAAIGLRPDDQLVAELERRGHEVSCHQDVGSVLASWSVDGQHPIVTTFGGHASDRVSVEALGALRRLGLSVPIVLLAADASQEEWQRASEVTATCHDASLPSAVLAALIEAAAESTAPRARSDQSRRSRSVVVRLWDSVEVDGSPVYLGVAERNFLFLLAGRPGQRIAKTARIDVGGGRSLSAATCRRRLGQRLSPELAGLLVPHQRYEPYRFREQAEVDALTQNATDVPPTRLRILGRGEVSLIPVGLLDSVA